MKKIVSSLLVLCLLVTGCLFFTSCGKVKAADLEENPQAVLNEAMKNTTSDFFEGDAKTGKVVKEALETGALTLSFASDDLMGGALTKISETIYMDAKNGKAVSDTLVTMGGEDLTARIFFDKEGLALNSEAILGSDKTLGINLTSFSEKFANSALVELFRIDRMTAQEIADTVAELKDQWMMNKEESKAKTETLLNDIYAAMKQEASEEKIELPNGKKVKCVVASYTLSNETIRAALDKAMADLDEESKKSLNEMLDEVFASLELNLTEKIYINTKTNKAIKETVTGTVTTEIVEYDERGVETKKKETATLNMEVLFTDTEISVSIDVTGIEEPASAKLALTKEKDGGKTTYKASFDVTEEGKTTNQLTASYSFNKDDGKIELALDMLDEEEEGDGKRWTAKLTGKLETTDNMVKLTVDSATIGSITATFEAVISFQTGVEIPAKPEGVLDVVELTQEDWMKIMVEFQTSKLGKVLMGGMLPE